MLAVDGEQDDEEDEDIEEVFAAKEDVGVGVGDASASDDVSFLLFAFRSFASEDAWVFAFSSSEITRHDASGRISTSRGVVSSLDEGCI